MSRKRSHSPCDTSLVEYKPYTSGILERRLTTLHTRSHKEQWNCFYRNNTINGYKNRNYLLREFEEMRCALGYGGPSGKEDEPKGNTTISWLEAGCGVGNAFLPILEQHGYQENFVAMYGFDISSVAIDLLAKKITSLPQDVQSKVFLATLDPTTETILGNPKLSLIKSVSFASMIFVLCSIAKINHSLVIRRIAECMKKPGGIFFFRDYAIEDHAQQRFSARKIIPKNLPCVTSSDDSTYMRTNGTLSHFFSVEEVEKLFLDSGFQIIDLKIVDRETNNQSERVSLKRKFIQGRFILV